MRYVLVDRIVALTPRVALRAVKNVTATDDAAVWADAAMPHLPGAMLLESMAQAAGLLVIASQPDGGQPVLAKVEAFAMTALAGPGDRVDLEATLDDLRPEGARLQVSASVGNRTIASAVVMLAVIPIEAPARRAVLASRLAALFPEWFAPEPEEATR